MHPKYWTQQVQVLYLSDMFYDFAFWEWEKPPTDWHTIVFDRLNDVVNFDDISSWLNSSLTLHL